MRFDALRVLKLVFTRLEFEPQLFDEFPELRRHDVFPT